MNIFLPYEENITKSVQSLDDVRLNKQAVECWQLLSLALKEKANGSEIKAGHYHHPVYLFYKNNIKFLAYYGNECCKEYLHRFKQVHKLHLDFNGELCKSDIGLPICDTITTPPFTPYYMEGSLGQPNYIRTTENVSQLFRNKLCSKWNNDKNKGRPPKWTNRDKPDWYKGE